MTDDIEQINEILRLLEPIKYRAYCEGLEEGRLQGLKAAHLTLMREAKSKPRDIFERLDAAMLILEQAYPKLGTSYEVDQ